MKSQALFDAMSAAVKAKGPEMVKLGGAVARMKVMHLQPHQSTQVG